MEDRIRVLLRDLAGDAPVLAEPPSGFRHETRMRRARSVLSTLVVLSLLAAAVIGARSFVRRVQVASSSCGTWTSEAVGFDGTIAAAVSFGDVIYAVGSEANGKGLSLLWDGKTWTRFDLPVGTRFTSIAGRSKNDVWAVGMRSDRSRNFSRPTKSGSISVSAPEPVVLHFDGTTWSVIPPMAEAAGLSVAVSPSGTVWVAESVTESVDRSATIVRRRDGATWLDTGFPRNESPNETNSLGPVIANADDDIYVLGRVGRGGGQSKLWHFDGSSWTTLYEGAGFQQIDSLLVRGPDDIWIGGSQFTQPKGPRTPIAARWDGRTWLPVLSSTLLESTDDGSVPNYGGVTGMIETQNGRIIASVWFGDNDTRFIEWDGRAWRTIKAPARPARYGVLVKTPQGIGAFGSVFNLTPRTAPRTDPHGPILLARRCVR